MIGFIKINRADILQVGKLQDMNAFILFRFCFFKIIVGQRNIFVRFVFEALHNVARPDFFSAAGTYFFIFDTAAVLLAELIKMNIIILRRSVKANRDIDHPKGDSASMRYRH